MKKAKQHILLFIIVASVVFINFSVSAQEVTTWAADKARLKEIASGDFLDEGRCQETWNILWPHVKHGEPDARAWLSLLLLPWPHMDSIKLPGRTEPSETLRDGIIVMVHTIGTDLSEQREPGVAHSMKEAFYIHALTFLTDESLKLAFPDDDPKMFRSEKFLRCLAFNAIIEKPIEDCSRSAIDKGLVPPFADFAAETDALLAQGINPKCSFKRGHSYVGEETIGER